MKQEFFTYENPDFLFVHIPKTGGTTVKEILDKEFNFNFWKINGERVEMKTIEPHCKFNKLEYKKTYFKYFKFVFVRHPYDWIKSYYNFHKNKSKFYNQFIKYDKKDMNKTFDQFLNELLDKHMNQVD